MGKSKSADDMDQVMKKAEDPGSPNKIKIDGPGSKEYNKGQTSKNLTAIANRARNVERKHKKMKSIH